MDNQSRTQIIATIGPASREHGTLVAMMKSGMDVARLNFSHGDHEDHAKLIAAIRTAAEEIGKHVPIIQDLSGPRLVTEDGHHLDPNSVEVITKKDIYDLEFGMNQGVDYVAMSFVRSAEDIVRLKGLIFEQGKQTPVIAKIERPEAVENIHAIIEASDAIMVARGDLGDNVPIERLPFLERDIITACKEMKKPVITATQMMLSMVEHPQPTRAEVIDVAYAVLLGSDAVMLSDESALGKYPVETVTTMERIVKAAEEEHLQAPL